MFALVVRELLPRTFGLYPVFDHSNKFDGIKIVFCSKGSKKGFSLLDGCENRDLGLDRSCFFGLGSNIGGSLFEHISSELERQICIVCPLYHN